MASTSSPYSAIQTNFLQDPFNHYNTEFVKLDANNWCEETVSENLIKMSRRDGVQQFALIDPNDDDETSSMAIESQVVSPDSINNKSFTDVTFIVGPPQHSKKYVGHRVLLAMTSPVFETMFYGDMADKNKYIRIADVAPIGFENLLRYAYTDSLNLTSVEDAMLTAYAAKKYLLPQLLRECLTYIEHNISPSTACVVFEFAHVLNSQQLVLQAMNLIDRQTNSVIGSKSFNHVQASTVEFVANRKYLNLSSEFALFNAVLGWSMVEARRRGQSGKDFAYVRSILSENSILNAVRFLAMSSEEFAKAIARSSQVIELSNSKQKLLVETSSSKNLATSNGEAASNDQQQQQQVDSSEAAENQSAAEAIAPNREAFESAGLLDDLNCLLNIKEQRAILLNLALPNITRLPPTLNQATRARQPPPEYFTLKRFKCSSSSALNNQQQFNLVTTTTTTRSIKSISSKFQCLSENVFIVALTIPIRLDASSYSNRTPKFECHLKFTTKSPNAVAAASALSINSPTSQSESLSLNGGAETANNQHLGDSSNTTLVAAGLLEGSALLMDTIDESLNISISRDRDCLVRLKRPILIRMGNINELTLTFQTYALDEDIVALQTPKLRSANFSEQTDEENISWLFFKSTNIEFSELHYYY